MLADLEFYEPQCAKYVHCTGAEWSEHQTMFGEVLRLGGILAAFAR